MHRTKVTIVEEALDANNTIAAANRADFDRHDVTVVNFMSAPGAGKTALLEAGLVDLPGVRAGVLEGDVHGAYDADRLAARHIPVIQLNTDQGFGGVRVAFPAVRLPYNAFSPMPDEDDAVNVDGTDYRVAEVTSESDGAVVCLDLKAASL